MSIGPDAIDVIRDCMAAERQATLLKLMYCSPTLLTAYDDGVIAEWTAGFTPSLHSDGTAKFHRPVHSPATTERREYPTHSLTLVDAR